MKKFKKLISKFDIGGNSILITESSDGKIPNRETYICEAEIYEAHIWIHDNEIQKNHTSDDRFKLNNKITYNQLKNMFNMDNIKNSQSRNIKLTLEIDGVNTSTNFSEEEYELIKNKTGLDPLQLALDRMWDLINEHPYLKDNQIER